MTHVSRAKHASTDALKHICILLGVALIGLVVSARSVQPSTVISSLQGVKIGWIIAGGCCFLSYLAVEGFSYLHILKASNVTVKPLRCIMYAFSDFFFSSLTPGGSGGQAGQFYMMQRDKIPGGVCLSSLLIFNMLYHVTLVGIACISGLSSVMSDVASSSGLMILVVYGLIAQIVFALGFCLLIFSRKVMPRLVRTISRKARKSRFAWIRSRVPDRAGVDQFIADYHTCGKQLIAHPRLVLSVIGLLVLQIFLLYAVAWCVSQALGLHLPLIYLVLFQSTCVLATESIPLPGGAGASEIFLASAYSTLMGDSTAFTLMLLTRALTLYLGIIIGGLAVSFGSATPVHAVFNKEVSETSVHNN